MSVKSMNESHDSHSAFYMVINLLASADANAGRGSREVLARTGAGGSFESVGARSVRRSRCSIFERERLAAGEVGGATAASDCRCAALVQRAAARAITLAESAAERRTRAHDPVRPAPDTSPSASIHTQNDSHSRSGLHSCKQFFSSDRSVNKEQVFIYKQL